MLVRFTTYKFYQISQFFSYPSGLRVKIVFVSISHVHTYTYVCTVHCKGYNTANGMLNDIEKYDGTSWTASTATLPSPRYTWIDSSITLHPGILGYIHLHITLHPGILG